MKASVKRYIENNTTLLAPVDEKVQELLKRNKLKKSKITVVNIHNYMMMVEGTQIK